MSKIYRSLDPGKTKVTDIDLRTRPMGPQKTSRPTGGFVGITGDGATQEVMSHIERRERESIRMLEEARRQAEVIQRDAYQAGFAQGERAGEKLASQKIDPVMKTFSELIEHVRRDRQSLIHQHEQELIKVAFLIATTVLHTTIEMQPEVLAEVVGAALAKVNKAREITLHVSPADRPLIELHMKRREGPGWPPAHLKIVADETIGRGGCKVATETGDIDATIETQLKVLKNLLWNE